MERKIYSAEYKAYLIKKFLGSKLSMRAFCKEKNLYLSTLESWLKKIRQHGMPKIETVQENQESNLLTPIDIASKVKKIVNDENYAVNNVFVYFTSYYDNPFYLYDFFKTRETTKKQEMLDKYKRYVFVDSYPGYDLLKEKDIKIQLCFAHIRRKFYDIAKVLSSELKKKSVTQERPYSYF